MSHQTHYSMSTTVPLAYEEAVNQVIDALKTEGFGVLTEIDMKATLKKKLDADFRRYMILGACNPPLAHQALQTDLSVGLLLPCNVIVYETGESESVVSVVDPVAMIGIAGQPELDAVASEARARLERVLEHLTAGVQA